MKAIVAITLSACILLTGCSGGGGGAAAGSSSYILHGLGFSPYITGQDPNRGATVSRDQVVERLNLIRNDAHWIRTFGSTRGLEHIPSEAKAMGLRTAVGAWLDADTVTNDLEIDALIQAARDGNVDVAIVGSEVLLRGDLTETALLGYINRVRTALAGLGIPVTTVETHRDYLARPNVIAAVDVLFVNFYPFWEGIGLPDAVPTLHSWYTNVQAVSGGKAVVVAETGWPSNGQAIGIAAVPSAQNAVDYFLNFVSWARAQGVEYFYFSALDEEWKSAYEGPLGAHWGIRDSVGNLKPGMDAVFNNNTVPDNWTAQLIGGPGIPSIAFTSVPPIGSFADLSGRVSHVIASTHRVAVYIRVGGGWWSKPTFSAQLTTIAPSTGTWTTDITTGGSDELATAVAAFLIPLSFSPPLLSGQSSLPNSLPTNALDSIQVAR